MQKQFSIFRSDFGAIIPSHHLPDVSDLDLTCPAQAAKMVLRLEAVTGHKHHIKSFTQATR